MLSTQLEAHDTPNPYSSWAAHCVTAVQELQTRVKEGNALTELCCRLFGSALGAVLAFEQAVADEGCVARNLREFTVMYSSLFSAIELAIKWVQVCHYSCLVDVTKIQYKPSQLCYVWPTRC